MGEVSPDILLNLQTLQILDNDVRLCFYSPVQRGDYKTERPRRSYRPPGDRGGYTRYRRRRRPRRILPKILLALLVLLLIYLLLPIGTQRVVLLGSDARADEASRSDTILVTAAGGHDGMLAVPRDTLLEIPGLGEDKVNAAFANGGPDLTVQTLEGFLDRRINNYVVLNFEGVEEIVNAMGGVTINVQEPVNLNGVSLSPGQQTLNGEEALAYVRYRGGPNADIGRVGRQQEFMQEIMSQALSPTNLPQLPATISAVLGNVETNMNPLEAARFLIQLGLAGERPTDTYPGTPQYIDGISYWVPDKSSGEQVMQDTIG